LKTCNHSTSANAGNKPHLGFEVTLRATAHKLRENLDASDLPYTLLPKLLSDDLRMHFAAKLTETS
jgi:hypothetical protein